MSVELMVVLVTLAYDSESVSEESNRALESLAHVAEKSARAYDVSVKRVETRNGKITLEMSGHYRRLTNVEHWLSVAFTRKCWNVWIDEFYYMTLAVK